MIGGTEIRARLSTVGLNSLVPLQLKDAIIQELDSGRNTKFSYAFISPKKKINGMTKEKEYKLKFLTAAVADTGANAGYLDVSIMPKVSLFINKQTAILSSDRIKMNGYFPIPKEISKKGNTTNNITISTFAILKNLSSYDVSFEIGVDSPVFLPIQKIMAKLTRIDLIGLGSANCGIGFGGEIWLKKKDRLSKDKDGVLTINKMEIVNKESGVTLAASMTLPDSGFSIKKLIFKTPGTSIDMAYDFGDHSFSFEAAGRLEFASIDTTGFFKDVFPIEIQSFKMRSKDWGVFLLAKPDIKINYKVVTINIEKLLINIGYDMSMDKMSELMTTPNKPQTFVSGGPDEEVSEDKTSWAIGIAGGVAFPIKDLKVDVRASLILANQNNAIQARLNKIAIVVDRSPVFLLKAGVMLSLSGKKKGFEADAALTVLSNGLEAYFKYYKIEADNNGTKAGMELGAAIKLKSSTGITTGPINWLSIGGGFDLNTSTNVYSAFLTGDITTPGTTRDMTYVAIDTLKILFSTNDCGPKPVVDGTGRLFIKNQAWGEIKAKADFCKNLMLVTVNASNPLIAGLPNISASGILFGMASSSSGSGAFFLSVNSTITSQIANGNVFAALGVNYNNNHIYAPQEIKTLWPSITEKIKDNYNTLHGIYFRAGVNIPYTSGGFDAGFVGLNYSYYLDGQADFGVKFGGTNDLFVNASLRFQLWAEAYLLFIKGYGNVDVNVSLNGGRLNQLWYLRGNGDATVDIGVGDWPGQYNSWVCHLDTWWVGCRWVKGFNVNKGLNASFDFTQGQSTKYNIRFK